MPSRNEIWSSLTPATTQVLFCDLQKEIVGRSKTNKPEALAQSAEVLAKIVQIFSIPITLSVVPENQKEPKLIPELKPFATAENQFLRAGASPILDPKTRDHLAALNRPNLILAGFATEVVVLHAAIHAIAANYNVFVAIDACGGRSDRSESAALAEIREAGAILAPVETLSTALAPDFSSAEGQKMFAIIQTLRLA